MITVNGERCSFSTGKQVAIEKWDKNKQQVRGKDEETVSLNNYLKAVKAKLYGKEAELLDRGFVITAQLLYDAYFDMQSVKQWLKMKAFRLIGMALFAIMMCVNFTACSSDDDEENFESSLIGTWFWSWQWRRTEMLYIQFWPYCDLLGK